MASSGEHIPEELIPSRGLIPVIHNVFQFEAGVTNVTGALTQRAGTDRLVCKCGSAIRRSLQDGETLSVRWQYPRGVTFVGDGERAS